jgi:hypothetical protein
MITAYRSCPKKFWWGYMRQFAPTAESVHLHAGAAFAKGLEVTRREWADNGRSFEDAIALGGAALLAHYGHFEPFEADNGKSALNMLGALGYYFKTWPIDTPNLKLYKAPDANRHAIEYALAVPIPDFLHPTTGDPLIYAGRFDSIMIWRDSMLVGEDDKTATQLGKSWVNGWRLSNQLLGYTWACGQYGIKLGGFNVRGVGLYKNDYGQMESLQMIPRWKLEVFYTELLATLADMRRSWESGHWRKDLGDACKAYGGCRYVTLCDSQYPEDWLQGNYVLHKWNPLASRD